MGMTQKDEFDNFAGPAARREIVFDANSDLFPLAGAQVESGALVDSYNRLQLIYRLGREICAETNLARVLAVVLEALTRLIDLERCFIAVFDQAGKIQSLVTHNI